MLVRRPHLEDVPVFEARHYLPERPLNANNRKGKMSGYGNVLLADRHRKRGTGSVLATGRCVVDFNPLLHEEWLVRAVGHLDSLKICFITTKAPKKNTFGDYRTSSVDFLIADLKEGRHCVKFNK